MPLEVISVPSYQDVINVQNIEILRGGADLQLTSSGSLALTNDGQLKLGDDRFNAMFRLVHGWRFNAPTLSVLFELLTYQQDQKGSHVSQRNELSAASLAAGQPDLVEDFHRTNEAIGGTELGCDACAGAIVVVLGNLLARFRADLKHGHKSWEKAGPLFGGRSFGSAIKAAGNNFRHHNEWAKSSLTRKEKERQKFSQGILAAVLEKRPDWIRHNVCPGIVQLLSAGSFERLTRNFFEFAKAVAQRD